MNLRDKLQSFGGMSHIRSIISGRRNAGGETIPGIDEKTLKRLSRAEVLELLIEQIRENDEMQENLRETRRKLEAKTITLEQSGSIAEAALHLNSVFEAADSAVRDYVDNNQQMIDEKRQAAEERLAELNGRLENIGQERAEILNAAGAEAREIIQKAEAESERMLAETKEESQSIMQEALATCERKYEEADAVFGQKKQEADAYWRGLLAKLDDFCSGYESLLQATYGRAEIPGLQKLKDEMQLEVKRRTTISD